MAVTTPPLITAVCCRAGSAAACENDARSHAIAGPARRDAHAGDAYIQSQRRRKLAVFEQQRRPGDLLARTRNREAPPKKSFSTLASVP
jgi:hypothetical protein